jgi:hypothetical protein
VKIVIQISPGELVDRLSILELKVARILDANAQRNVRGELTRLRAVHDAAGLDTATIAPLRKTLDAVNRTIWALEDALRAYESNGYRDERIVACALALRRQKDARASLKRRIDERLGSAIREEKCYAGGGDTPRVVIDDDAKTPPIVLPRGRR